MKIAIVIPAYNEARTIRDVARRAIACGYRVAVVDDGSSDATSACVSDLPVRLFRHERNLGKGAALATGFAWALGEGCEAVATLDGDGQHSPEDVARLLGAAEHFPDRLVIAARLRGREAYPRIRTVANRVADFFISWAAGHAVADSQSGQRIYPARLLKASGVARKPRRGFSYESDIVVRAAHCGFETIAVPVAAVYDPQGRRSHFRPVRDIVSITLCIAGHLLSRGLNPAGLWRVLRSRPSVIDYALAPVSITRAVDTTLQD